MPSIHPESSDGRDQEPLDLSEVIALTAVVHGTVQGVGFRYWCWRQAEKLGLEQGFKVVSIEMPADRPSKEWMFVPALALLALVVVSQRRRVDRGDGRAAPQPAA